MGAPYDWLTLWPQIDALLAEGVTQKDIAERIGIREKTLSDRLRRWRHGETAATKFQPRKCLDCRKQFVPAALHYFMCPNCRGNACDMGAYSVGRGGSRRSGHA